MKPSTLPAHSLCFGCAITLMVPSRLAAPQSRSPPDSGTARKTAEPPRWPPTGRSKPQRHHCYRTTLEATTFARPLPASDAAVYVKLGCWATLSREQRIYSSASHPQPPWVMKDTLAQQLLASAPAGPLHRATAGIHWMLQAHIVSNAIIC